jgi:hypothetical protein
LPLDQVTKSELARIKERFNAFLKGEMQIPADEAFTKAIESYYEVFLKSERVAKVVQAGGFSANDFREVLLDNFTYNQLPIVSRFSDAMLSVGFDHCLRLTG